MSYQFTREYLIQIAHDTLNVLKNKNYTVNGKTIDLSQQIENSVNGTILYPPESSFDSQIHPLEQKRQGKIVFTNETTTNAVIRLKKELNTPEEDIVALNFASARTPGGAYLRGTKTQEESLARQTTLIASIQQEKTRKMYEYNATLQGPLYSDYMIYTPGAVVFRDDNLKYLPEPVSTSIITSAAANLRFMRDEDTMEEVHQAMIQRIRKILQIAILNNNKTIVLGAFGCGYFANDPYDVANYFKKILIDEKYIDFFDQVIFAIIGRGDNLDVFKEVFNANNE